MAWRGGSESRGEGRLLAAACVLAAAALACRLGGYPLLDPDEGRNAEVAREMAAAGDYLVPRLDGLPYLDKPVLFFALDAAAQRLLGSSETVARVPALLCSLAAMALTGWFARRLYGREAGWVAALAAGAAPLPLAFARTVIFDSMLALWVELALIAFYLAIEAVEAAPARGQPAGGGSAAAARWSCLAWAAMGLGVLTKGPVALAVPLLAAVPYAAFRRASRAVWHPVGPLLLAALVAPWLWAMSREVPDFLHYAVVTETWQRVTTDELRRTGPFWYFVPLLLAGAFPWTAVAAGGWRGWRCRREGLAWRGADGRRDGRILFLLLWIALPLLLFSLSQSKRPQYILPLMPAVALLAAGAWSPARTPEGQLAEAGESTGGCEAGEGNRAGALHPLPGARAAAATWLALGGLLVAAYLVLLARPRALPAYVARAPGLALAFGLVAIGAGCLAWLGAARRGRAAAALALPVMLLPALAAPLMRDVGRERSARDLAAAIAPILATPGAQVVGVAVYPPSLPFYLRRTILVTSRRGHELTSNYIIQSFARWLAAPSTPLRPAGWWRGAVATCDRPWVFVTWSDDLADRAALAAAGLPAVFASDRFAAYGPCHPPAGHGRVRQAAAWPAKP
jgi:4-amino-4-deoxy-L-arabinose transferase-like glycosyltransferase